MPVRCKKGKPRYRVKTTKTGKQVRLAFCGGKGNKGGKVVEATRLNKSSKGSKGSKGSKRK